MKARRWVGSEKEEMRSFMKLSGALASASLRSVWSFFASILVSRLKKSSIFVKSTSPLKSSGNSSSAKGFSMETICSARKKFSGGKRSSGDGATSLEGGAEEELREALTSWSF